MPIQDQWKWCATCQGLFYGPNQAQSRCPAGGTHSAAGTTDYAVGIADGQDDHRQPGWRWCRNCQVMFFGTNESTSVCPASPSHGPHVSTGSGAYVIFTGAPLAAGQQQWAWCRSCQGLFYGPNAAQSVCPSGTTPHPHDGSNSGSYTLAIVDPVTPGVLGQVSWSQDALLPNQANTFGTSASPAAVAAGGGIHLFHEGKHDNGWLYHASFDGQSWSGDNLMPEGATNTYGTSDAPGAALYRDAIHVLQEGKNNERRLWHCSFDGSTWSADQRVETANGAYQPVGSPAAVVYNDKLYVFYEGAEGTTFNWAGHGPTQSLPGWMFYGVLDGGTWSDEMPCPNPENAYGTSARPAVAVFQNKIYIVHQGKHNDGLLWGATFDGSTFSTDTQLRNSRGGQMGTSGRPSLVVWNNVLWLFRPINDKFGKGWMWFARTTDGLVWYDDRLLPADDNAYGCGDAPGAIVYNNQLHLIHEGMGPDGGDGWVWRAVGTPT